MAMTTSMTERSDHELSSGICTLHYSRDIAMAILPQDQLVTSSAIQTPQTDQHLAQE
jgi:hypothetical protein